MMECSMCRDSSPDCTWCKGEINISVGTTGDALPSEGYDIVATITESGIVEELHSLAPLVWMDLDELEKEYPDANSDI